MLDLLNQISSDNLLIMCIIMSAIAMFLALAVIIELLTKRNKTKILINKSNNNIEISNIEQDTKIEIPNDSNLVPKIEKIEEIKYVEEDSELEKTKAKLELEKLKEELIKEEARKKQEELIKIEEKLDEIKDNSQSKEIIIPSVSDNPINYEDLEEENAIISYEELKNANKKGYTDEEMNNYLDEENAPISIFELEKLYAQSKEIPANIKDENKEVMLEFNNSNKIDTYKEYHSTPFISPVHGIKENEEQIKLEQTANLEKLNEEIRKTNEFLKALKELRKNLE